MNERKDSNRYEHEPSTRRLALSGLGLAVCALGVLTALGLAAAVVGASQADAASWLKSGTQGVFGHRGGRDRDESLDLHAEFMVEWILRRIDASEEQTEKVKQIVAASMDELRSEHESHAGDRAEIVALLSGDALDRDALERFRQEQVARVDRMTSRLADTLVAIAAELTPEQRRELVEMAEQHHGRRHGWHR